MPEFLIFVRCWKGFGDDFPFERFDDVPDEAIADQLEMFCCGQLWTREVMNRIRERRRARKAAVARRRRQMMHPPNLPETEGRSRSADARTPHAKIMAAQNERADLKARSRKGELCILDPLTGMQRRWVHVDRHTGERRYTLRPQDPDAPSLGCRIAYSAGWLKGLLTRFGGLSPSRRLFVGGADAPVQADDLTRLFAMWNGPEYGDLPLYQGRFEVVPAHKMLAVDQANHRLSLRSLLSRDPTCLVEAVQKRVAGILPEVLEALQTAQPGTPPPAEPGEDEPAGGAKATENQGAGERPLGNGDSARTARKPKGPGTIGTAAADGNVGRVRKRMNDADLPPSRLKAKAAYDWAMQEIDGAEGMTIAELHDAIMNHPQGPIECIPDNAATFGVYLREAGVKQYGKGGRQISRSVRRSEEF